MARLFSGFIPCHSFNPVESRQSALRPSDILVARASAGSSCKDASVAMECAMILGVDSNAPKCEVKTAYRKLALRFHPDVCKGGKCEIDFMKVNRAYETLISFPSCGDGSTPCQGFEGSEGGAAAREVDPWSEYLHNIVSGTHEELGEDYSNYYSNLKCYSKAGRKRKFTGYSQYYQ
uniref:J domain-containing protein n=1 Tax=Physcomitrium patens TaxID=3218 RepID=A9RMI8_PHYPA|nr:hypothetical protein PHYPA_022687 [Physcomitrium patens]